MNQTLNPSLGSLVSLGIISEAQCQTGLASDIADRLHAATSAGEALFWLVTRGIVPEAEVDRQADESAWHAEKQAVLLEAQENIAAAIRSVNAEHMDVLLAQGLIDADQHEAGLDIRPQRAEGVIDSPGRALAVLVNRGVVTEAQFDELKAAAALAGQQERSAIVDEAARITHEIVGQYVKAMSGGALRVFGLIMLAVFSLIGLAVWLT